MLWLKKNYYLVLLSIILLVGAFLHFRNLSGAIYLDEDEARAFALLSSGQIIYLMSLPFFKLFLTQSSAFYVAAFLGWASIALFYFICRALNTEKSIALMGTLIYAVWPLRIDYARTLYPAVFVEFYFLLSFLFTVLSISRNSRKFSLLSGIFAMVMFLCHYSAYSLILGIVVFPLAYSVLHRSKSIFRNFTSCFLYFVLGLVIAYLFFEYLFMYIKKDYILTQQILSFLKVDIKAMRFYYDSAGIVNFWGVFSKMSVFRVEGLILLISAVFILWRKRNSRLLLFCVPFVIALLFLFVATILGAHTFKIRNVTWLIALYSFYIGVAVVFLFKIFPVKLKPIIAVLVLAAFLWVAIYSYLITTETFTQKEMNVWLKTHNISKKYVATWWDLYVPRESVNASLLPVVLVMLNKSDRDDSLWYLNSRYYKIFWPIILQAYQNGLCKYIITSGPSEHIGVGLYDDLLADVKPLMSWLHPYSSYRHRFFYQKETSYYINVYNLEDVFKRVL